MAAQLPALNLVAQPGQRRATLDLARDIERRGFAGISVSSQYSNMAQCLGLAFATERIPFATAIAPIYAQTAEEFAQMAAYLHEVSGGRFQFGIGVAHPPSHARMGVTPGKPLADIRAFVANLRSVEGIDALPPIILAALRKRMVALAAEIADGVVFANASLSHISHALGTIPAARRDDPKFFIGNRIRTCVCDDEDEAKAVLRRTVTNYALMPYYRNYWLRRRDDRDRKCRRGRADGGHPQIPAGPLARGLHLIRAAGQDTRRGRSVARRRDHDAGAAIRRRQPEHRDPTAVRRVLGCIAVVRP